jgi:hypothetical protein
MGLMYFSGKKNDDDPQGIRANIFGSVLPIQNGK